MEQFGGKATNAVQSGFGKMCRGKLCLRDGSLQVQLDRGSNYLIRHLIRDRAPLFCCQPCLPCLAPLPAASPPAGPQQLHRDEVASFSPNFVHGGRRGGLDQLTVVGKSTDGGGRPISFILAPPRASCLSPCLICKMGIMTA